MILIIEIIAVSAALFLMFLCGVKLAKNARGLGHSAKKAQERIEPKLVKLGEQGVTAQKIGMRIVDRAEELERSGAVLSVTMGKMAVLLSAAAETRKKLRRVTGYIGL